jgi:hypothetical protein
MNPLQIKTISTAHVVQILLFSPYDKLPMLKLVQQVPGNMNLMRMIWAGF